MPDGGFSDSWVLLNLYYNDITSPSLGFHDSALETGRVDLNKIIWRYEMQERGKEQVRIEDTTMCL